VSIEQLLAMGDQVIVRSVLHGTHLGAFWGLPPSGKPLTLPRLDYLRFADGKIVEHWASYDPAEFLGQLGMLSA
jgi:predicted ester cyclase